MLRMVTIRAESTFHDLLGHPLPFLGFQVWDGGKAEMPGHSDHA